MHSIQTQDCTGTTDDMRTLAGESYFLAGNLINVLEPFLENDYLDVFGNTYFKKKCI
jgi:hypothetical protein